MSHWSDYSLRGWLSFLAFMHLGLTLRALYDPEFLYDRVFTFTAVSSKEPILVRFFAAFSLAQTFVLLMAAIHLYIKPIQIVAIFTLTVFSSFVLVESVFYQTVDFYGGTLLPCTMSIISIIWLLTFHYVLQPWTRRTVDEELQRAVFMHEGKRKGKSNQFQPFPLPGRADHVYRLHKEMEKVQRGKVHCD